MDKQMNLGAWDYMAIGGAKLLEQILILEKLFSLGITLLGLSRVKFKGLLGFLYVVLETFKEFQPYTTKVEVLFLTPTFKRRISLRLFLFTLQRERILLFATFPGCQW